MTLWNVRMTFALAEWPCKICRMTLMKWQLWTMAMWNIRMTSELARWPMESWMTIEELANDFRIAGITTFWDSRMTCWMTDPAFSDNFFNTHPNWQIVCFGLKGIATWNFHYFILHAILRILRHCEGQELTDLLSF